MEKVDIIEVILHGSGSDISIDLHEPLVLPPQEKYEAKLALKNFSTYNNIPNVTADVNNKLKLKVPGAKDWETVEFFTGAYEIKRLNTQLQEWIKTQHPKLEDVDKNFKLVGNEATAKAEFIIVGDYHIDFDVEHSIYKVLGWNKKDSFGGTGMYFAPNLIDIVRVTQMVFNCNIVVADYVNNMRVPFIYNCGVNVPAGYKMVRELTDLSYKSITTSQINHIRVWIVDEHGAPVNLRNDRLTVTLSLRLAKTVQDVAITQGG